MTWSSCRWRGELLTLDLRTPSLYALGLLTHRPCRSALVLRLTGNFWHNRQMVFDEVSQVCLPLACPPSCQPAGTTARPPARPSIRPPARADRQSVRGI